MGLVIYKYINNDIVEIKMISFYLLLLRKVFNINNGKIKKI